MVKVISLFLIGMAVLAMFGRLRLPKALKPRARLDKSERCPKCGQYVIGTGGCACGKPPAQKG